MDLVDVRNEARAPARTHPMARVAWSLLILNTLGSAGAKTVIPIPRSVMQLVTMGALLAAFGIALALNHRLRFRPSAYLMLLSAMLLVAIIASVRLESGYGALFRCFRLALFVLTLWLLTPWWNGGMAFVWSHLRTFGAELVTVAIGLVISPGKAMPDIYGGRLSGAMWPLTPPQVG